MRVERGYTGSWQGVSPVRPVRRTRLWRTGRRARNAGASSGARRSAPMARRLAVLYDSAAPVVSGDAESGAHAPAR